MGGLHLLITCHPSSTSLCARVSDLIVQTLTRQSAKFVVDDLVALNFCPSISASEFANYLRGPVPDDLDRLVDHLRSAEHVIFVFPVWMYTMPAILKGYFDRVWRPGVSFMLQRSAITPLLCNIRELTVVVTHGMDRLQADRVGDGSKAFFETSLPSILPGLRTKTRFDIYGLDTPDPLEISSVLDRIEKHFSKAGLVT